MNDKYNRAQFEQYAESQGLRDFEYDQDDASRYRNPFTQREWNYWVAALECVAQAASATPAQPVRDEELYMVTELAKLTRFRLDGRHVKEHSNGALVFFDHVQALLAQPLQQEGGKEEDLLDSDALRELLVSTLEQHRMVNMYEVEDHGLGNSYPLIDCLSLEPGDIKTGKEEIEAIADAVIDAIEENFMSIISNRIHDRACLCQKCLTEFERETVAPQPSDNMQQASTAQAPQHDSDCSLHNAGVPELLGPCDCSLSAQATPEGADLPPLPAQQVDTGGLPG